jgi:lipopolysaccharide/colanic/teichoic acid biosynthesis glycosyltransferase
MKRLIDIVVSALALIILSPVLAIAAFAVRLRLGRPVLFQQARPGLHGRIFTIYKFRTMRQIHGSDGRLLPDGERMTRFGRLLRRSSIDELPELWNVLRGEMSLVGPRPLLVEYLPLYSTAQARRHDVRPGLTGWAQVNGRNAIDWDDRFALDVWYVDHRSLWLDLTILMRTVAKVSLREGIVQDGHVSMEPFRGPGTRAT